MKQPKLIRRCSYRIRLANSYQSYRLQVIPGGPGARAVPSNRSGCTNSSPCQAVTPHELAPADITGILCYTAIKRGTTRGRNQLAKHSLNKWNRTLLEADDTSTPHCRKISLSLSRFWRKAQGNHDIKFDWIHNTSHIITHTKIKIHQVSHFYTFLPFSLWNRVPRWFLCPMAHHGQLPARAQDLLPLWHQGLATGRDDNEDSMRTLCIMIRIIS